MKEETTTVKTGKPWDILGYFNSYVDACSAREEIVAKWKKKTVSKNKKETT